MSSSFSKGSDCTTVHLQKYSVPEYTTYFLLHIQCSPLSSFLIIFIYYLFGGSGSQLQHTGPSLHPVGSYHCSTQALKRWCTDSVVAAIRLSYPSACGILVPQKARSLCPCTASGSLTTAPPRKAAVSLI